jgi:hypothetical protein
MNILQGRINHHDSCRVKSEQTGYDFEEKRFFAYLVLYRQVEAEALP